MFRVVEIVKNEKKHERIKTASNNEMEMVDKHVRLKVTRKTGKERTKVGYKKYIFSVCMVAALENYSESGHLSSTAGVHHNTPRISGLRRRLCFDSILLFDGYKNLFSQSLQHHQGLD